MPKPTNSRPTRVRARSSVKYCQEHSSCSQEKPNIAVYKCRDCKSVQCEDCSRELHSVLHDHEFSRLEPANPQLICSSKNCHNFADFFCPFCQQLSGGVRYCVNCDRRLHSGLSYNHQRIPFDQYLRNLELESKRKEEEEKKRQQLQEARLPSQYISYNAAVNNLTSNSNSLSDPDSEFLSLSPNSFEASAAVKNPTRSSTSLSDPDSEFLSIAPSNLESAAPLCIPSEDHTKSAPVKEFPNSNSNHRDNSLNHSSSQEGSLEEAFFTIKTEVISSDSPEMRGSNSSSSRGRVPRFDRQGSTDSSVMRTMGMESRSQHRSSILLIDDEENLKIGSADEFLNALGMKENETVKVVSIFGNTGVGKSYTMNAVFFRGEEVFKTSATQVSCTYGVWVAYDHRLECLVIDTEGLLGQTDNEARRRRLLLKVLGISDVIIYKTNASRLESDMFHFLHDASKAYEDYFAAELKAILSSSKLEMPVTNMSPMVIIFQETKHTVPLSNESNAAVKELHRRAKEMKISLSALPGLRYVGIQTSKTDETDFEPLKRLLMQSLSVNGRECDRIPRPARVVYEVLSKLNKKYSGDLPAEDVVAFSSKYFSCRMHCKACDQRCQLSLNHEESQHHCKQGCQYRADIGNRVFMCRQCHESGKEQLVRWQTCTMQDSGLMSVMMFLKRGHIIECPRHGVIYRSFEHWYNNPPPEAAATIVRTVHVWPGDIPLSADGTPGHVGQRIIDIGKSVTQAVSPSIQVASEWMSDQVAPEYWTPNSDASRCFRCNAEFTSNLLKHHCRRCGKCVCEHCSGKQMVLRSWGTRPVRVCDPCYERGSSFSETGEGCEDVAVESAGGGGGEEQVQVTARVVTETVGQAAGVFSSVFKHSANWVKDWARPSYWKPDSELIVCSKCKVTFGPTDDKEVQEKYGLEVKRHHCRRCGDGFCTFCSSNRHPVPSRGWESPVRVCDSCSKFPKPL